MIKKLHSVIFYAADLGKTAEFYKKLGFEVDEDDRVVRVVFGDFKLAFIDENKTPIKNESGIKPKGTGVYVYIEIEDVDKYFQWVKKRGVEPRTQPRDWEWGKREFVVKDPDGYKIVFYSPIYKN